MPGAGERRAGLVGASRNDVPDGTPPESLLELLDIGATLCLTDGEAGGLLAWRSIRAPHAARVRRYPAIPSDGVVDPTGAGDAFIGAMAAVLSAGNDLPAAVGIAVRAGSHAVTRPGAQESFASAAELGIAPLRTPQPEG